MAYSKFFQNMLERREAIKVEIDTMLDAAGTESRTDLTDAESAKFETLMTEARDLDKRIAAGQEQAASDAALVEARSAYSKVIAPATEGATRTQVVREERTYRPDAEFSFIRDAYNEHRGDRAASDRLARHSREYEQEARAVGTDAFAGLVIPQYLVDLAAPLARAGRPFADFGVNKHELPAKGMTLNISRLTTGTSVDVQVTQNDTVSETDADDTLLTVNVRTIAGQQNLSRQSIERGEGIDTLIVQDLVRAYHAQLDAQVLKGAGTAGTLNGLRNSGGNAVTFTATTPTVALLYPKLADAMSIVEDTVYSVPTHWVMTPRRLAWILAATDTAGRPLALPTAMGPQNAVSVGAGVMQYGNSGYSILGLPVITDANIGRTYGTGTNQDEIYCVDMHEMHLWENAGAPLSLSFDQTVAGGLTIKTLVYGYAGFTAERYAAAASIISGTGLVAPTF